jgi:hypothetical protein
VIENGKAYLVHTHLGIWLGRVVGQTMTTLTLDDCSWIADQGRMGQCVAKGTLDEIEFIGDGVIVPNDGTIKVPWKHKLPDKSKP